jgi:uncharacterized protein YktA (UPF0223 family)
MNTFLVIFFFQKVALFYQVPVTQEECLELLWDINMPQEHLGAEAACASTPHDNAYPKIDEFTEEEKAQILKFVEEEGLFYSPESIPSDEFSA